MNRYGFISKVILFTIIALTVLSGAPIIVADDNPEQPLEFTGSLKYQNGDNVSAGAEVCAYIDGELRGNLTTVVEGRYGVVPSYHRHLPVTGNSTDDGKNITFKVDGVQFDPEFHITDWGTNASTSPYATWNLTSATEPANITSWGNDKTNDDSLHLTLNESESVRFNATANQTITAWNWLKDGAAQSNTSDNYTTSWSVSGTYTASVNATNANGTSDTKTWTVTVNGAEPSPCYIATATYGSPLDSRIDVLRDFRDELLLTNPIGGAFVSTYYTTSPPIADALRENDGLRTVTRLTLITPLVYLSKFLLNGILVMGIFIIGSAAVLSIRTHVLQYLTQIHCFHP